MATRLDPEYDLADCFSGEVIVLRAAYRQLEQALGNDAHKEEAAEARVFAERVETSAWALAKALRQAS
jgi:hypothetical protein